MSPVLLLGQLLASTGEIRGRKKLQKIVHLLQTVRGVPFGYSFQFSFFGPYSADLKAEIEALSEEGLVVQVKSETNCGFPTFHYSAGEAMKRLLDDLKLLPGGQWLGLAKDLNTKTPEELEGISTVVFLQRVGWAEPELGNQFRALKPKLASGFEKYRDAAAALPA